MTTKLARIADKAKAERKLRFTSLAHLLTPEFLLETWKQMNHKGASGVDGETTKEFESDLETRVEQLCVRLKAKQYRPPPVRRVEIPKGEGKTRPLGIPTVEDRLLQRAVARISAQSTSRTSWSCPTDSVPDATRTKRFVRFEATSWQGR
jgi:retron-type reverse transcriptase